MSIYLNGKEAARKELQNVTKHWLESSLFIGRQGNEHGMKGLVDEIRIWKNVMNITEIYNTKSLVSRESLVAQYSLNEGEGQLANDRTSSQSPGKILNADWLRSFAPK
eukprot:gene4531-5128_t